MNSTEQKTLEIQCYPWQPTLSRYHGGLQVEWSADPQSKIETQSRPFATSSYEIAKIMMLSLALIQSGKILISVQYPGKSHHAYSLSWGLHGLQGAEE